jgi:hypothetical protein
MTQRTYDPRTYDPRTYDPRFDRRPTLLIWALATAVCVLVLAVAVFVTVQPAAPPSTSNGNPAIHARSADGSGGSSLAQDPIHRHVKVVERLGGGSLR